jgi:hypothetical protein
MDTTKRRMVLIAAMVCFFAVGMAGLLNFFKYRSTADGIVTERLLVIGHTIENSIQQSLSLGLQFSGLDALPAMMERERANDDLILSVEVFDTEGHPLYATGRAAGAREMPASWLASARRAGTADWFVKDGAESATGVSIENNFGLTVGYLAVRYDSDRIRQTEAAVAWQLAWVAIGVFAVAATLASLALIAVMNRLSRHVRAIEAALPATGSAPLPDEVRKGPFGPALGRLFANVQSAESQINTVRSQLARGSMR